MTSGRTNMMVEYKRGGTKLKIFLRITELRITGLR